MLNLIIADNQLLTREGLIALLADIDNINVAGIADTPAQLKTMLAHLKPDVIVIDIDPVHNFNISDVKEIHHDFDLTKVLVLSNRKQKNEILEVVNEGVKNFVGKNCSRDELISAIYATAKSEQYFCESTMKTLFGDKLPAKKVEGLPVLSLRETEIVNLIAEGKPNKDIADQLFLSVHTVRTHRKNIIKKLGFTFKNAAELVLLIGYINSYLDQL